MKNFMPIFAIAAILLVSCTTPQAEPADSISGNGDRLVGTVRVVGSAPVNVQVVLQPESGRAMRIAGPLAPEIEKLAGARVALRGRVESAPDPMVPQQVVVESYEIISVDGQPVTMGTIEGQVNNWTLLRTASGELVYLAGPPEQFRRGQKVWIQGPSARIVQTYGVLTQ
ncbi:hypothetical protein BH23GEM6_BH23GEM6_20640 [soil metagenome]